jgi:beta-glucanase (GH16 family)
MATLRKNEQGFSHIIMLLLGLVVVATIGYVGWKVSTANRSNLDALAKSTSNNRTTAKAPTPLGVKGAWKLKYDDEFSDSILSSLWKSGWWDASTENTTTSQSHGADNCYAPTQVSQSGGYLNLAATAESCTTTDGSKLTYKYASGAVNTAGTVTTQNGIQYSHSGGFYFTYGYAEARMYIPPSKHNPKTGVDWPAFWMVGNYTRHVITPELDVAALLGGRLCGNLHAQTGHIGICSRTPDTSGWHTFGANWQPSGVTFYVDGVSIGKLTSYVPTTPMYLFLDLAVSSTTGNPPVVTPANMKVDYVRVWQ